MAQSNKFGTFKGVFTPSILTILGVIMFMRLPMIVGEAGLFASIGIIVIAHIISGTTGLSVSSIATDKKVKAGGTYYMISRSLGLPIGGTLGLALFVGLSFSVSLYLIGFSESFLAYWDLELSKINIRITGTIILLVVTVITFISTSLALKTQYFIMAAIVLSLLSIFFGNHEFTPTQPLLSNPSSAVPMMLLFGIFFPAVTGFEAGVSMSGDLKDPKKSIPLGSISAILVGLVVYIFLAMFFAYNVDAEILASDPAVLLKISWVPELVLAGIWGATLSSAFGSILGAPRILQATALDKITPKFFAKGTGATNEPRNALLLTFLIAEAGILIGELDVIARVVSIFFITTYGFLNLSAAFERMTSADFRPTFKPPVWISFIGAAACFIVMIQLDFVAMIAASIVLGALYLYLKRKELVLQTGDAWGSIWASLVKSGIKRLNKVTIQTRNWRPNVLMFSGDESTRPYMIEFGLDITGRLGILTGFELKVTEDAILPRTQQVKSNEASAKGIFMNVHACHDLFQGMDEVVRLYGFNGIEPNTVLMGWSKNTEHRTKFVQFLGQVIENNLSALFVDYKVDKGFGDCKTIDIWWSGWGNNLSFAISLLRHLTSSARWKDPVIRLFTITKESPMVEILHRSLEKILIEYRVSVEIKVVNNSIDQLPVNDIIWRESETSDLIILGIPGKSAEQIEKNFDNTNNLIEKLGTCVIINASSTFEDTNLVAEMFPGQKKRLDQEKLELPELKLTEYPIINDQIIKIDEDGLKTYKQFFEKTIDFYFTGNEWLINELVEVFNNFFEHLQQNFNSNDGLTAKIWTKTKNDFYKQTNAKLEKYADEKLFTLKELFAEGIDWYQNGLEDQVQNMMKKLVVRFPKAIFKFEKSDTLPLRWLKLKNYLRSPFAGKGINLVLNFRKIAIFYLRDSRFKYLNEYLYHFNSTGLSFIAAIRDLILQFETRSNAFIKLNNNEADGTKDLDELKKGFLNILNDLQRLNTENSILFENKLLLEFRRNLQLLCNDLGKINATQVVDRKRRTRKYYKQQKDQNSLFAETWYDKKQHYVNLVHLDLQVSALQLQVLDELYALRQKIDKTIDISILSRVRIFIDELRNFDKDNTLPELIVDEEFLQQKDFTELIHMGIDKIVERVPENIQVADIWQVDKSANQTDPVDHLNIPLKNVAKQLILFVLAGSIESDLKNTVQDIKKVILQIKDHISYMHFELENVEGEISIDKGDVPQIIQGSIVEIEREEIEIREIIEKFNKSVNNHINNLYDALAPHKIAKKSREISQAIRELQVQKSKGYLTQLGDDFKAGFKELIIKIMYSKSEGILLARELSAGRGHRSLPEQMLELIDALSPKREIYETIPVFYKNLFSGRSSISEDFWIERPIEQIMFEKACRHYQDGYHGAVMVLGERNSGKTAFCRFVGKKYFSSHQLFNVFPPATGSIDVKDLTSTINQVTNLSGSIDEVFDKLPQQTVIIFNDIELWWESSENGLLVVNELLGLISRYCSKCFFILNTNVYSYQRISSIIEIEVHFISVITCQPFDSEDLKDLVMRRHRSAGLKINYGGIDESNISEIKMAGIFNKYFNYCQGNPGLALFTWLASVTKAEGELLFLEPPQRPQLALLNKLNETWQVILSQLLLHKRMDIRKLQRVMQIETNEIVKNISALKISGLVTEKSSGIYIVNPVIDKFLSEHLVEGGYL